MSIAEKDELKREWGKKESCRQQIQTSLGGVLKNGQYLEEESRFREYLLNIYVVPSVVIGFSSVSILTTVYKLVFAILLYGGENTISASDTSSIRQNLFVRTN